MTNMDNMLSDAMLDTSDVESAREAELNKLRSTSASPSTISTASSGSPLVRGSSGSSAKRPAPTSIAAAQLQCQQQQQRQRQLEFTNKNCKLYGSGKKSSGSKLGGLSKQTDGEKLSIPAPGQFGVGDAKKPTKGQFVNSSNINNNNPDNNKSPGFKMAKSIAFKAYRFNQFWSANKMRYMNLACLFMTVICLTTIVIYNWNQSAESATKLQTPSTSINRLRAAMDEPFVEPIESLPDSSQALVAQKPAASQSEAGAKTLEGPTFDDFNLFSSSSNSQDNTAATTTTITSSSSTTTTASPKRCPKCHRNKSRRKSDLAAAEREMESEVQPDQQATNEVKIGVGSAPSQSSTVSKEIEKLFGSDSFGLGMGANSGFESLMKQIERIASAAANNSGTNSTGGLSMLSVKPIRNKNGRAAGLVISANIIENGTTRQLNDSTLPLPNFEKLFPSILRPTIANPLMSLLMKHQPLAPPSDASEAANGTGAGGLGGVATITIGGGGPAETLIGSSLPLLASSLMRSFTPPSQMMSGGNGGDTFMMGGSGLQSAIMEPPPPALMFRSSPAIFGAPMFGPSPFGSLMGPPPMFPPPGLLSMLLRGGSDGDEPELMAGNQSSGRVAANKLGERQSDKGGAEKEERELQQSASHATSNHSSGSASAVSSLKSGSQANGSPVLNQNDAEVELIDQQHHQRASQQPLSFQNLYSSRPPNRLQSAHQGPSGSMLIFNSVADSPVAPSFVPFGLMAPPMMVVGGSERPGASPLSPMLRAILSNVMSEIGIAATNDLDNNSGSGSKQNKTTQQNRRAFNAIQSAASELDDEWEASERWDEQQANSNNKQSKQQPIKASHRGFPGSSDQDAGDSEMQNDGMMNGIHLAGPEQAASGHASHPNFLEQAGLMSGTIRQTIRGPGLSVERLIDIPTGRVHQQVGPGIKSQSLSLRPDTADNEAGAGEQQQSSSRVPLISASSMLFGGSRPATIERISDGPFPPPVGFIGRLLSDLSRRASEHQATSRRDNSQQRNLVSPTLDEDLDEGDSEELSQRAGGAQPWPRLRLSSAKIRMSPLIGLEQRQSPVGGSQSQPETFLIPPGHFAMAASEMGAGAEDNEMQQDFHHQARMAPSFEDTLNSMEDRLSHVLAIGGKSPMEIEEIGGPTVVRQQQQQMSIQHPNQAVEQTAAVNQPIPGPSTPTPATSKMSSVSNPLVTPTSPQSSQQPPKQTLETNKPKAGGSGTIQKQLQQPSTGPVNTDPFTSPNSPLFGFPATSNTVQQQQRQGENKEIGKPSGGGSNRQQRSFTYHSNNELAGSASKSQAPQQALTQQHLGDMVDLSTSARARFSPFLSPPTGAVMGRRLDESFGPDESAGAESPLSMAAAAPESQQQQRQQAGAEVGNQHYWMWP